MLRPARPPTPTLSPALGPTRDRQKPDRVLPRTRELCGQAPSGERCLFTLALQTLPMLPPLQGLPGQAALPPASRAQAGQCQKLAQAQPLCVCVYVCGATSPPAPGRGLHTHSMCAHTGLGMHPGAPA